MSVADFIWLMAKVKYHSDSPSASPTGVFGQGQSPHTGFVDLSCQSVNSCPSPTSNSTQSFDHPINEVSDGGSQPTKTNSALDRNSYLDEYSIPVCPEVYSFLSLIFVALSYCHWVECFFYEIIIVSTCKGKFIPFEFFTSLIVIRDCHTKFLFSSFYILFQWIFLSTFFVHSFSVLKIALVYCYGHLFCLLFNR